MLLIFLFPVAFYLRFQDIFCNKWERERHYLDGKTYFWGRVRKDLWGNKIDKGASDELGIAAHLKIHFGFYREKKYQTIFKWFGICNEIQTGDKEFDKDFFIICDNLFFGKAIAQDQKVRDAITNLLSGDIKNIRSNGEYLWVTLRKSSIEPPANLNEILTSLHIIVDSLKHFRITKHKDPFLLKCAVISGINTGLLANGFSGWLAEKETLAYSGMMLNAIGYTLLIGTAWLFLVIFIFQKSSRGGLIFIDTCVIGCLGILFTAHVTLYRINQILDVSTPKKHYVEVLNKTVFHGRRGFKSYLITVKHWDSTQAPLTVVPDAWTYNEAKQGQPIVLMVRRGYLKYSWIEEIDLPKKY